MNRILPVTIFLALSSLSLAPTADAQDPILSEIYGRGVHAFYSGQHDQARQLFSSAIDNGIKDPRAYYFRGIVSSLQGRSFEAESDWRQGAMVEAQSGSNPSVGRSLSRFQGSARLKLEQIRQKARLQAMMTSASRSNYRTQEIQSVQPPMTVAPATRTPLPGAAAISPAPAPPAANDDPFKDDTTNMASGTPVVESDDALKGADGGLMGDDAAGGAAAPAGNPFGSDTADGPDPFGGSDAAGPDPFGGSDAAAPDPFGGSMGGDDDPFN